MTTFGNVWNTFLGNLLLYFTFSALLLTQSWKQGFYKIKKYKCVLSIVTFQQGSGRRLVCPLPTLQELQPLLLQVFFFTVFTILTADNLHWLWLFHSWRILTPHIFISWLESVSVKVKVHLFCKRKPEQFIDNSLSGSSSESLPLSCVTGQRGANPVRIQLVRETQFPQIGKTWTCFFFPGNTGTLKKKGGTLPRTGSKESKDSSTLLKTLDEERGEV